MRKASGPLPWLALVAVLALLFLIHLAFGGVFTPSEIWSALIAGPPGADAAPEQFVLWSIRLPRAVMAVLVGSSLAIVGAAFQALFRNPLADPYIVGVSSGAAVGGALASLLGLTALGGLGAFGLAFATAVAGLIVVIAIGYSRKVLSMSTLLLAGVAVGSFLWALITLILVSAGQDAGRILFWLLGSLVAMDWNRVLLLLGIALLGFLILVARARPLTMFSVGEDSAARLGVEVETLKWTVLLTGSAITAAAVSAVGIVGFVGLFVPHIARRLVGSDLARLLPASALVGAAGLLIADLVAQRALPGREINIGVITAIIGAPFLIVLLRKK